MSTNETTRPLAEIVAEMRKQVASNDAQRGMFAGGLILLFTDDARTLIAVAERLAEVRSERLARIEESGVRREGGGQNEGTAERQDADALLHEPSANAGERRPLRAVQAVPV